MCQRILQKLASLARPQLSLKARWPDLQWGWRPQTGHRASVVLRVWPAVVSADLLNSAFEQRFRPFCTRVLDPGGGKMSPKSALGGLWAALGRPCRFLSELGGLLGGSWGALGALLAPLGAVLAPLGPLLAPLGALLGLMLASRGLHFRDFEGCFSIALAKT